MIRRHRDETSGEWRIEDLLGECLDALFQGATVEECLARHPDHAQELAPLLRLAARIAQTPPLTMSPAGFERLRRRVQAAVAAVRAGQSAVRRPMSDVPGEPRSDLSAGPRTAELEPRRRSFDWLGTLGLAAIGLAGMGARVGKPNGSAVTATLRRSKESSSRRRTGARAGGSAPGPQAGTSVLAGSRAGGTG